jgi:hypothetical protein
MAKLSLFHIRITSLSTIAAVTIYVSQVRLRPSGSPGTQGGLIVRRRLCIQVFKCRSQSFAVVICKDADFFVLCVRFVLSAI